MQPLFSRIIGLIHSPRHRAFASPGTTKWWKLTVHNQHSISSFAFVNRPGNISCSQIQFQVGPVIIFLNLFDVVFFSESFFEKLERVCEIASECLH
jgi:hypothetical protein